MASPYRVRDIRPGSSGSQPMEPTPALDLLFFLADDGIVGQELWVSNGSEEGTDLVKDIRLGGESPFSGFFSNDSLFATVANRLYFTADDGQHGLELWTTDGQSSNTFLLADLQSGMDGSFPSGMTLFGKRVFFAASTDITGRELWVSDGTKDGTVLFKDLNPGTINSFGFDVNRSSSPGKLTAVGDKLFFSAYTEATGQELWITDGTTANTKLLKDINPSTSGSDITALTPVGNRLFFSALHPESGRELWTSDGTAGGTVLVKDINPGDYFSNVSQLTPVGDTLFFTATDGTHGLELWRSQGAEASTRLVKDIGPDDVLSGPKDLVACGERLFFAADDGSNGPELWVSDGNESGTAPFKDIVPGPAGLNPQSLTVVGDRIFFTANDGNTGRELWSTDGTAQGTTLLADINPGAAGSDPTDLRAVGNRLFFTADNGSDGRELWALDVGEAPITTSLFAEWSRLIASVDWSKLRLVDLFANSQTSPDAWVLNLPLRNGKTASLWFQGTNLTYNRGMPTGGKIGGVALLLDGVLTAQTSFSPTSVATISTPIINDLNNNGRLSEQTLDVLASAADVAVVALKVSPDSVREDLAYDQLAFTFSRYGPKQSPLIVKYSVSGTALAPGQRDADYEGIAVEGRIKKLQFAAGAATAILSIDPIGDDAFEPDESVAIKLVPDPAYVVVTPSPVVGTIVNDDSPLPLIRLTVSDSSNASVREDAGQALTFTFIRDRVSFQRLNVRYKVEGSATLNQDYSGLSEANNSWESLTIPFDKNSLTATLVVKPIADPTIEVDETVEIKLLEGSAYRVGTPGFVVGTIVNDDINHPPLISLSQNRDLQLPSTMVGQRIKLADLLPTHFDFAVSDPDGNAIKEYEFYFPDNKSLRGGYLQLQDGSSPPGLLVTGPSRLYQFNARELASIDYVYSGRASAQQRLGIKVADSQGEWSEREFVSITVHQKPIVGLVGKTWPFDRARDAFSMASYIFNAPDPEGDLITAYTIEDRNQDPMSGYFRLGDKALLEPRPYTIPSNRMADLQWIAGSPGAKDQVTLAVTDALGDVSDSVMAVFGTGDAPTGYLVESETGFNHVTEGDAFVLNIRRQNNIGRESVLKWAIFGADGSVTAGRDDFLNVSSGWNDITFSPGQAEARAPLKLQTWSDDLVEGGKKGSDSYGTETAMIWFYNGEKDNGQSDWAKNPAYVGYPFDIHQQPVYFMGGNKGLLEGQDASISVTRFGGGNKKTSVTVKALDLQALYPGRYQNQTGLAKGSDSGSGDFVPQEFRDVTFLRDETQTFRTGVVADGIKESGPEVFAWALQSPSANSSLLEEHSVRLVTINDRPSRTLLNDVPWWDLLTRIRQLFEQKTVEKPSTPSGGSALAKELANPANETIVLPDTGGSQSLTATFNPEGKQTGLTASPTGSLSVVFPPQPESKEAASLVGNDAASLVGNDAASLVGNDAASLVGNDAASLVAPKNPPPPLVGNDAASLVAHDAARLVGNDAASLVGNDAASLVRNAAYRLDDYAAATVPVVQSPDRVYAPAGTMLLTSDFATSMTAEALARFSQYRDSLGQPLIDASPL